MRAALIYWEKEGKSGTERYARSLIREMRKIAPRLGVELQEIPLRKVERSFLGRPIGGHLSLMWQASRLKISAEAVHSLSPEVISPRTNFVTVHDVFPLKYPEMYSPNAFRRRSNEKVFRKILEVDWIISVSKATKRDLEEILGIDPEKVKVIYEGVDFSKFFPDPRPPEALKEEGIRVLLVGDLNPRKKYEVVFEAALQEEELYVYHVGSRNSWEERWKRLSEIAKDSDGRINLIGPVSDEELRRWLSSVDFFAFPTLDEGFGLPALEAMACGTNVLLSDIPIFHEIVGEMASGYFDLDPESFLKALEGARRKRPEDLIEYARKFNWSRTAEETLNYYLEVLESS